MKQIILIANGILTKTEWLKPHLIQAYQIGAVDGGTNYLHQLNHLPTWFLGDGDSITPTALSWLHANRIPQHPYPTDKDATDLELALQLALQQGADEIMLVGTIGGRLDQELGNLLLLFHPAYADKPIVIHEPTQIAFAITETTTLHGSIGDVVSFIPLSDDVWVTDTTGLRWPINNERLSFGSSRTVSNEFSAEVATITIQSGKLLCIQQKTV